jgi:hypothetical protein
VLYRGYTLANRYILGSASIKAGYCNFMSINKPSNCCNSEVFSITNCMSTANTLISYRSTSCLYHFYF